MTGDARPDGPGFYWAKWLWRIADDGTREGDELTPLDPWEVVEVFKNTLDTDDEDHLRVAVAGVETSQPLISFFWGRAIRLTPPNREIAGDR